VERLGFALRREKIKAEVAGREEKKI